MNDLINTENSGNDDDGVNEDVKTEAPVTELQLLKERAKAMGIPMSGNIGLDALKARVDEHLKTEASNTQNALPNSQEMNTPTEAAAPVTPPSNAEIQAYLAANGMVLTPAVAQAPTPVPVANLKADAEMKLRKEVQIKQMALVRCQIYNLNPSKRDLNGEIVTVANRYLGTVRKFIPFGEATDGGYHIPRCIYNDLKSRKFQSIRTKNKNNKIEVSSRMVPEYSINVMPNLNEEERQELAVQQGAAERLGSE